MINFTGSTNRRVVNLGDRRRGRGASFLQQTHRDHQQREEQRRKDRAAAVIRCHVKRHLELVKIATEMSVEWHQLSGSDINWDLWSYEFAFIVRFCRREQVSDLYEPLKDGISELEGKMSAYSVAVLIRALKAAFDHGVDSDKALGCLFVLLDKYPFPIQYPRATSGLSTRLLKCLNAENYIQVVKIAFWVQSFGSVDLFIDFIASIPAEYVFSEPTMIAIAREKLSALQASIHLDIFSDEAKIKLFANTVALLDSDFRASDSHYLAIILSKMDFVIKTSNDDSNGTESIKEYHVNDHILSNLAIVESSAYLMKAAEQLQQWDRSDTTTEFLLPYLFIVFPDVRLKLCMICTISTGLLKTFHARVSSFSQYESVSKHRFDENHLDIFLGEPQTDTKFSILLFAYSHLLSYWLTVTNDQESFHESNFLQADARNFTEFLKNLTLLLILKPAAFPWSSFTLLQQKNISILVLNQLYIKNLRIKFLPQQFWIARFLKLNINSMILLLQAEQKRIEEEEDLSSGDEDILSQTPFSFKMRKKKPEVSGMSPMIDILKKVPFFVDFTDRVAVFRGLVAQERERINVDPESGFFSWDPHLHNIKADIRREHVLEDAFEAFHKTGSKFKHQLRVTFHNEYGEEAGIDGGGITKEFLTALVTEAFNPGNELALFKQTDNYNLYPNPGIYLKLVKNIDRAEQADKLSYMRFVGMVIGKCLFEGVLIDFKFAHFFLSKWRMAQSTKSSMDDLAFLDKSLFNNLIKLLDMSPDQLLSLDLNFDINENIDGEIYKFSLGTDNESQQAVNASNRLKYIHLISNFKLNQCIQLQTGQFLRGLFDLIKPNWLNLFDPFELQMLVSGTNDINLEDWKQHVNYGGYWETDATIQYFWQVVEEMDSADRKALVKFVTSVSRAPLLGFAALEPKFGISRVPDDLRLPTASTCANLLKLPQYKTKEELREKLFYSIHANSGFDLS